MQAVAEARNLGLDEETARTALERHGTRIERILALVADEPGLGRRILPDAPFCVAEIIHAAESEMVGSLEDVVRRRVPLMLIAPPPPDVLAGIAARLGDLLGWDRARRIEEVAGVRGPDPAA